MLAIVRTVALTGLKAHAVQVEADVVPGLPCTQIVGLPDVSVREAKERVHAAIRNSGFEWPAARITVNLAPAGIPKEGSSFDLPIALALLAASGQASVAALAGRLFLGELSLDGTIRPVRGTLVAALAAREAGVRGLVVPEANGPEAASAEGLQLARAKNLKEVVRRLADESYFETAAGPEVSPHVAEGPDLSEVQGQPVARRALEIAAAGGHNILLIGPPGTGKTMLARRLPTLLPSLGRSEILETTAVHSVAGTLFGGGPVSRPPFRAPHHTVSDVGLVGGGNPPRPGEVSLAHHGVLFLDELPEFRRSALEALRQPIEDRRVTIVRAGRSAEFPAAFQLVASMNPCACGHEGTGRACVCTSTDVRRYRARVSGPLLDRIDLHVRVPAVDVAKLTEVGTEESSAVVAARVAGARELQRVRSEATGGGSLLNAVLESKRLREACALPEGGRDLLVTALRRRGLSARALHRVMRVARTIADLEGAASVKLAHLAEAVRYRVLSDGRRSVEASAGGSGMEAAEPEP